MSEGLALDIALVDLFAGLRTAHVTGKDTRIKLGLNVAAEECRFANTLANNNKMFEVLFKDIRKMDNAWARAFVSEALHFKATAILVIRCFPCTGLSRARGAFRENLKLN